MHAMSNATIGDATDDDDNDNRVTRPVSSSSSSSVPAKRGAAADVSPRAAAQQQQVVVARKRIALCDDDDDDDDAPPPLSRKRTASASSTTTTSEQAAHERATSPLLASLAVTGDDVAVAPIGGVPAHVWLAVLARALANELAAVRNFFWRAKQGRVSQGSVHDDVAEPSHITRPCLVRSSFVPFFMNPYADWSLQDAFELNARRFSFVRFIVNNVVTTRWSMRVSENAIFDASNEKQLAARAELADELQRTCDSARLFCQDAISRAMHTILVSACDDPYVGCCCRTVVVLVGRPPQHNRQQWPAMVRQYCDFLLQYRLQAAH